MNPIPPHEPDSHAAKAPFDWVHTTGVGPELAREVQVAVRRRKRRAITITGASFFVLLGIGIGWRTFLTQTPVLVASSSYRVSEPVHRMLPDGSEVDLNGAAVLTVEFRPEMRRVLLQGEAHFTVAKDKSRPFVVVVSGAEVRAVGTAFNVEQGKGTVDVVVTEGRVAVTRPSAVDQKLDNPPGATTLASREVQVDAGRCATIVASEIATPPQVRVVSLEEISRRLAWRVPSLAFDGTPLSEVARLFASHGGVQIEIADSSLRGVKVSGILRADNTGALLQLLADDHGIEAEKIGTKLVLRRRH
jgi:transmembrane sensor